jgi:hypothetical protein
VKVERFTSDLLQFATLAKVRGNNCGDQKVNYGLQNALNLTYAHLQFKNFSRGWYPRTPVKGRGRKGKGGRERLGGNGRVRKLKGAEEEG